MQNLYYVVVCAVLLVACQDGNISYTPEYSEKPPVLVNEYIFGVHPLYNPKALQEIYGPLAELLTKEIPNSEFRLEASRDYAAFDEKLYSGKFHFALPNPYQTVNAMNFNYHVFGKQGDDYKFCGIIIVRKSSQFQSIKELKNRSVSFPAPTALAATMMPQYYIHTHGLNVMEDIDIKYVGSQESSIMSVYSGNTDACATWPVPWIALIKKRPDIEKKLEVKWRTEPMVNNSLMARNDVPKSIIKQVSKILFNLHTCEEGKHMLERMEVSKMEKADNETYEIVKTFLHRFNKEVRPIKLAGQQNSSNND